MVVEVNDQRSRALASDGRCQQEKALAAVVTASMGEVSTEASAGGDRQVAAL